MGTNPPSSLNEIIANQDRLIERFEGCGSVASQPRNLAFMPEYNPQDVFTYQPFDIQNYAQVVFNSMLMDSLFLLPSNYAVPMNPDLNWMVLPYQNNAPTPGFWPPAHQVNVFSEPEPKVQPEIDLKSAMTVESIPTSAIPMSENLSTLIAPTSVSKAQKAVLATQSSEASMNQVAIHIIGTNPSWEDVPTGSIALPKNKGNQDSDKPTLANPGHGNIGDYRIIEDMGKDKLLELQSIQQAELSLTKNEQAGPCYNCGGAGHHFLDCKISCGRCGGVGHAIWTCFRNKEVHNTKKSSKEDQPMLEQLVAVQKTVVQQSQQKNSKSARRSRGGLYLRERRSRKAAERKKNVKGKPKRHDPAIHAT